MQGRQELPLWAVLVVAAGVLALGLKGTGAELHGGGAGNAVSDTVVAELDAMAQGRALGAGGAASSDGAHVRADSSTYSTGLLVPVSALDELGEGRSAISSADGAESGENEAGGAGAGVASREQKALLVEGDPGHDASEGEDFGLDERSTISPMDRSEEAIWRGLREEGSYQDGVRHGAWRAWRSDGSLRWVGNYDGGLRDGLWESYGLLGRLERELQYEAGSRHGDWRAYGESGALIEEGSYDQDHASGRWTVYYSSGQIKERGRYVHGLREGVWEFYDDLGVPTLQAGEYRAGVKIQ
ncbi:MAG: toxin-antitoxin system YwqK family antitoxin [Planctomycetota bacterium]